MDIYLVLLIYLEAVNLLALLVMGLDKHRAKVHRRRIPEATLMTLAAIGGSIGVLGGMFLFRHKTRKPKFYIGIPVILAAEVLFFLAIIYAVYS